VLDVTTTHEELFTLSNTVKVLVTNKVVNEVMCKKKTVWWYAPEFKFQLVHFKLQFKYEFGRGLAIRSFSLDIGGVCILKRRANVTQIT